MIFKELNSVISHRLRGFDTVDASLQGLKNALRKNIPAFEIDTRVTADGEIVIHHDPYIHDISGQRQYICDMTYDGLKEKHAQKLLPYLPAKLIEFLREMQMNNSYGISTFLDIKEFGREKEILRLFDSFSLKENLVVVSWLPEVLFAVHELDKTIPLCFSHYPLVSGAFLKNGFLRLRYLRNKISDNGHDVFYPIDAYNKTELDRYTVENKPGDDYEHLAIAPIQGQLLEVLQSVKGMVCCDKRFTSKRLVERYHKKGIRAIVYSAETKAEGEDLFNKAKPDFILSNTAELCAIER
jgi:glycerophosphoryl diester phosphodiesterase